MGEPVQSITTALELRRLVKRFGSLIAVDHLTLALHRGEIFGLLGPNGAGKTTTIRMICGLIRPTSGEILMEGVRVKTSGNSAIRSRFGVCPQENILWTKLTCFEQLVFSARIYGTSVSEARQRADQMLMQMGLQPKRNKLASTLSGGMKRRMNIIMAMMHDPDILVFDEPEAGLDPQSKVMVREFIRELASQKSVIITTHNMDEAERMADRVAIMDHGRLLQLDTPDNLKKSIGEGDVLVVRLSTENQAKLDRAMAGLSNSGMKVQVNGNELTIRAMGLIPRIHEIYQLLERGGTQITELKIRTNTLEDVFIHLTGKSLRS
jgi:ABC-2 type transport system ATP-binding protein